jgi:hypothetical protein
MRAEKAESRFRSLSIISVVFRVLGYIAVVFGILAAIIAPFTVVGIGAQITAVVGILLAAFIQTIIYFALSDIINAILEIDNTTMSMRRELRQGMPAAPLKAVEGEPGTKATGTGDSQPSKPDK